MGWSSLAEPDADYANRRSMNGREGDAATIVLSPGPTVTGQNCAKNAHVCWGFQLIG